MSQTVHSEFSRRPARFRRGARLVAAMAIALAMAASIATHVDAAPPERTTVIVVLKAGAGSPHAAAAQMAQRHQGQISHVYEHAISGFSIAIPPAAQAALERNPNVEYVEVDHFVTAATQTVPTGISRAFVDQGLLDINGVDDRRVDADVAILDSGIDLDHPDLDVAGGVDCISATCTAGGDDDNAHGTHVAGIVAALDNEIGVVGVAPGARLWSVKVLDGDGVGSLSGVLAGLDWVTANAATIEVANMSLGGPGKSRAQEEAIQAAVDAGVAFAVAAGNNADQASRYSPAAFDSVMTVSALADFDGIAGGYASPTCTTETDDTNASFSNYGRAIDIAAPGVCIVSTMPVEMGAYGTGSGTSMSSPHVAGGLALLASLSNPATSAEVHALYADLIARGNFDWTDNADRTTEPLLDLAGVGASMIDVGPPPPTPTPTPEPTPGPTPTPTPTPPIELTLQVTTYKVKGKKVAEVHWAGADAVNILRDGPVIAAGVTESPYIDEPAGKGRLTVSYLVCTTDMTICSDLVYASW